MHGCNWSGSEAVSSLGYLRGLGPGGNFLQESLMLQSKHFGQATTWSDWLKLAYFRIVLHVEQRKHHFRFPTVMSITWYSFQ